MAKSLMDDEEIPDEEFGSAPWLSASTRFIDRLLKLPTSVFWATLTQRDQLVRWLDDVMDWIPRPYEMDRMRALEADGDALAAFRLLKGSALALFLRIAVHDRQRDQSMNAVDWLKTCRPILPLSRFARWIAPFAPPHDAKNKRNRSMFAKALENWSNVEGARASEDMITLEGKHIEELSDLKKDIARLVGVWNSSRGVKRASVAEIIMQFLEGAVDWLYCAMAFYRVTEAAKLRCRPAKLVPVIGSMVESFSAFLTTENAQELAMHLCDYPIRRVFRLCTQVEQFGVELAHDLMATLNVEKRTEIIHEVMVNERFLFLLNDRYGLKLLCQNGPIKLRAKIADIIEAVNPKQEKVMLSDLNRRGLFKNLGNLPSMPQRVAASVEEVHSIFPNYPMAFIHACLRHVGYDADAATDMIVSNKVPGVLRRLEKLSEGGREGTARGKKRWWESKEQSTASTRPPIIFDHEDCNLLDAVKSSSSRQAATSAVREEQKREEEDGRNVFKGVFSLAPVQKKKEEPKEVEDVAKVAACESRAASSAALSSIRVCLERLSIHAHGEDEAFGMEKEKLVEMKGSKAHATANKYKSSAAERTSLRPFYEKFKYETDEMDVYNDEYDDGYEEKAFSAEPLTNDVASSDEENKKKEEEREKMERRREGGGRRGGGTGGEGRGGGNAVRGGRGSGQAAGAASAAPAAAAAPPSSSSGYTGGRQRQLQEKNKNKFRQRGVDRKMRGAM